VERFVAEVADRGHFTHRWALSDMPRWEPLFRGSSTGLRDCRDQVLEACRHHFLWRLPGQPYVRWHLGGSQERNQVDTSQLETVFEANVSGGRNPSAEARR
jgi:hypothetical protein